MAYILDAGALVAIDRDDQTVHRLLRAADARRTSCAVVSQVWRNGAKQARLALALSGIEVIPLDDAIDRRIGEPAARFRNLRCRGRACRPARPVR